jgi:hypothetical protein
VLIAEAIYGVMDDEWMNSSVFWARSFGQKMNLSRIGVEDPG